MLFYSNENIDERVANWLGDPLEYSKSDPALFEQDQLEAVVEEVEFCGCTNEELEAGHTCGQPTCPNNLGMRISDTFGQLYNIVRFYADAGIRRRTIKRGVTRAEAQFHCSDPETSSSTATNRVASARTRRVGRWFDGFEQS